MHIQISCLLQLIWIYTVCKCRTYPGSAGQRLTYIFMENLKKNLIGTPLLPKAMAKIICLESCKQLACYLPHSWISFSNSEASSHIPVMLMTDLKIISTFYFIVNVLKFANSADPDEPTPGGVVWSGSTLFAIPRSFRKNCIRNKI